MTTVLKTRLWPAIFVALVFNAFHANAQLITTMAGTGYAGYAGDGSAANTAQINQPFGVATDDSGNVYIADYGNNCIRKVHVNSNIMSTIAGTGNGAYSGDGGPAKNAEMKGPCSIAIDHEGNMYVAEYSNSVVRKITAITGIISTVAGTGSNGYNGDGMPATIAQLNNPYGIALDDTGNLYIADYYNQRVRKVSAKTGLITTIAGNGGSGYNGDNIPATTASLAQPSGVAVDSAGNVYIADEVNNRVRRISAYNGYISTVAGTGIQGYNGENIAATNAKISYPFGITINGAGNIYISEYEGERVRKISLSNGFISTVAGTGVAGYNADYIPATDARLFYPLKMAIDAANNLYIADMYNNRIRKVLQPCDVFTPSVHIQSDFGSIIGIGQTVTFTATPMNGGTFPVYVWCRNGIPVAGASGPKYKTDSLADNDIISCMLHSNSPCAVPDTGWSNELIIGMVNGVPKVAALSDLNLYPNPSKGVFTISGHVAGKSVLVDITDVSGRTVYKEWLPVYNGYLSTQISMPADCKNGNYTLRMQGNGSVESVRFSLVK